MRKFCVLLAGVALALSSLPAHAKSSSPDLANFTFVINPANTVVFTNTSTIGSEPGPRTFHWSFGDGSQQWMNGPDPVTHQYQGPGNYTVCLYIYRVRPNLNDTVLAAQICKTVIIETVCQANFETVASTSTALGKYFVAQPSHNQNKKPVQVCWNFGDNSDTCIQYSTSYTGTYNVYHLYAQPGAYNVCVRIVYDGGCEAQRCRPVTAGENDSCRADFERIAPTATNNPLQVSLKALPWHNHDKKPVQVCWTFGDNRDTCIQYSNTYPDPYTVNHIYANAGSYQVCVKIIYQGGCESMNCKVIEVHLPDSCRANFERVPIVSVNNPLLAGFHAIPWHNNGKKPSRICWTFGDNRDTCINYGQDYNGNYSVAHQYPHAGQYQVCVKIIYYGGCEAHFCKPVGVGENSGCSANIFEITQSNNSLERNFYAGITSVPPHPVESICWRFGDGTDSCVAATATTPPVLTMHHVYPGPGVYHVCIRVVFQGGCVAENCKDLIINSPNDLCGGYMTDSLIAPRTFKFKGFAIHRPNDPVISFHWTFGDGSAGNGPEVTHTYANGGEYRVCLTIVTQSGCETKICNTIRAIGGNQTGLVITPNPVLNIIHALFYSTQNELVTIKIVNATGVVVRTYTRNVTIGANNWDFDVSSLAPGPYLFSVQSPNQLASALFLKQ
jgi:PKD repeat protein